MHNKRRAREWGMAGRATRDGVVSEHEIWIQRGMMDGNTANEEGGG